MDNKPLLDAIDLDDEEQVIHLLTSSDGKLCAGAVNAKLSLPGWPGFTLLQWAAQRGHLRGLSLLLACGANINAADDVGDTVLHHAARFRRTGVVALLSGALSRMDLNARNRDGDTPLHVAAASGAVKIVKMLVDGGARLNEQNKEGDTPLHKAARCGNSLALKLLLTFDDLDVNVKNREGDSVLHLAVARGKVGSVEALLFYKNAGTSLLDARNKAKLTPLLLACSTSSHSHRQSKDASIKDIVDLLLQEGADVNARDVDGNTALHQAARTGNVDVITALLTQNEGPQQPTQEEAAPASAEEGTPSSPSDDNPSIRSRKKAEFMTWVTQAVEADQDDVSPSPNRIKEFYSTEWQLDRLPSTADARVNLPNKEGETPLHLAARHGHRAAADALLDLRASVNKLNKYFDSPLDYAFKAKHDTIAALLISRGAEVSSRIKHALVELAVAEVRKNDLVPRPRYWDLHDLNLLHTTAMSGRTKILEALLESGGRDVNARNEWRQTPLHCAAILGKTAVVMSLVGRQEVRANAEDKRGKTALQYAVECKHSEVEKLLLERADVKESMDRLYRDRQVYVDAANAVLVGAALIGGVTYAGWLQPPLGYVDQGFADLRSLAVRVFWVFNSLSFCFAMCTVLAGAGAILPRPDVYIASVVREVRRVLALAAFLMVLSIMCVLAAFSAAGFAVVQQPGQRLGPLLMGATITPGVSIALGLMTWFIAKMLALLPHWCIDWWRRLPFGLKFASSRGVPSVPHDHHRMRHSAPSSSSPSSPYMSGALYP